MAGRLAGWLHLRGSGSGGCIFHATPAGISLAEKAWIAPEFCENIVFATTRLRRSVRAGAACGSLAR
ncbi:hypothetical protein SXCC_01559 [Gluconacetobacter sp. SXCC-1]|nr:hypothetical protein SXCC_01559 [Gluconacetobacter sp. SXCC-1]